MVPARRASILTRIWKYLIENCDPNEEQLPSAVCARCSQILIKIEKGEKTNNDQLDAFDFSKVIITTQQDQIVCAAALFVKLLVSIELEQAED